MDAPDPPRFAWWLCRCSQVLIHRFATHAKLACNVRLSLAGGDAALQVGDLNGGQRVFSAPISAALLGEHDALALSLGLAAEADRKAT